MREEDINREIELARLALPRSPTTGRASTRSASLQSVTKQRFEAVVHMLLNMAMKQREAGLIGRKVHNGTPIIRNHNRILNNSGSFLSIDLSQFETVPVKMHGMSVVGTVAHNQPVARSLL